MVTLFGTGLGPDPRDETAAISEPGDLAFPIEVFLGGKPAEVLYHGRADRPGRDRLDITIPAGALGCYTSVWTRTGNYVSNFPTIAVAAEGGLCGNQGFSLPDLEAVLAKPAVSAGWLSAGKFLSTAPAPIGTFVTDSTNASFVRYDAFTYTNYGGRQDPGSGSCVVTQGLGTSVVFPPALKYLDAGATVAFKVQGGAEVRLTKQTPIPTYVYSSAPPLRPLFLPASGGTLEFAGTGGEDVGAFSATIAAAAPFTWTNRSRITAVNRSQPLEITWEGGEPDNSYMIIYGAAATATNPPLITAFNCAAPTADGRFTVPRDVLSAMVASATIPGSPVPTGQLALINYKPPVPFTAPGLDVGTINYYVWDGLLVNYP